MAASNGAGTLRSTSIDGVKLYSLTGNRCVAPWVLAKKKRPPQGRRHPPHLHQISPFVSGFLGKLSFFFFLMYRVVVWFLEYQRRLDLVHDLRFETAITKIKVTPDEQYVIASGVIYASQHPSNICS